MKKKLDLLQAMYELMQDHRDKLQYENEPPALSALHKLIHTHLRSYIERFAGKIDEFLQDLEPSHRPALLLTDVLHTKLPKLIEVAATMYQRSWKHLSQGKSDMASDKVCCQIARLNKRYKSLTKAYHSTQTQMLHTDPAACTQLSFLLEFFNFRGFVITTKKIREIENRSSPAMIAEICKPTCDIGCENGTDKSCTFFILRKHDSVDASGHLRLGESVEVPEVEALKNFVEDEFRSLFAEHYWDKEPLRYTIKVTSTFILMEVFLANGSGKPFPANCHYRFHNWPDNGELDSKRRKTEFCDLPTASSRQAKNDNPAAARAKRHKVKMYFRSC